MKLITLHEAALIIGVTYPSLSREWRNLGWQPVASRGRQWLLLEYAIQEYYLSYQKLRQGNPTIRWLPWNTKDLGRAIGRNYPFIVGDSIHPPFYTARHREKGKYHRRYNPLEIIPWARIYGYPVEFLAGFKGVGRRRWEQYCRDAEGPGDAGAHSGLDEGEGDGTGQPAEEEVG